MFTLKSRMPLIKIMFLCHFKLISEVDLIVQI